MLTQYFLTSEGCILGRNVGVCEGENDGLLLDWGDGREEGVDVGWGNEGNGDGFLVGCELGLGDEAGDGLFEGEEVEMFAVVGW